MARVNILPQSPGLVLTRFCGNNAQLHVKGEGEDNRRRGDGARHRGMACNLRVGVAVGRINQGRLTTFTEPIGIR